MKRKIIIIAHNIRSAHNIGSLFRTADGLGVEKIYLSGYSPCPSIKKALYKSKAQKEIEKTALGAQEYVSWEYSRNITSLMDSLREKNFFLVALEQDTKSIPFYNSIFKEQKQIAILIGNEVRGLDKRICKKVDAIAEIPMMGYKNSFNVTVSCGIFLGILRYTEAS
ncbi:MAG: TrmH family RNA methyltransferase [Candidatus Moranbacteria bacterium]|nr:TrmH family RNA methyltransferase [Candidatus Moranbacteria bacterium]